MKSKYAHFGPFLRIFLRTFSRIFTRILVIIRDYHPKPTPHTLQTMDTPPSTPPPRCKGGELSEGRRIAIAVEVALAIPPGKVRVPKGSMGPICEITVLVPSTRRSCGKTLRARSTLTRRSTFPARKGKGGRRCLLHRRLRR